MDFIRLYLAVLRCALQHLGRVSDEVVDGSVELIAEQVRGIPVLANQGGNRE
jgi:hypothetical protein